MLQLQLIGRLGKDAELVGKNKDITTFSVAVGKGKKPNGFDAHCSAGTTSLLALPSS